LSYQVLARKWRPKSFAELMGQEHVVRALTGGLENGRLHHAFLFTGTRGVGKTTIARIIAKALNCEVGVSATPCNQCASCRDIDAGRFPDMLEIDAASRTKVDDTREILDNVMYAPSRGRFKVYLIDEVHMLSTSSFNALLKTLEEPPEHVKFLLATTDPQKLPVTVLSRCLKFHLKRLTISQIDQQMQHILNAENISFEAPAVDELARAADGSMRDGLSLLDQALAFCGGNSVLTEPTREMLGTLSRESVLDLLEALADLDPTKLSEQLAKLADFGGSYSQILARMMEYLHQFAFLQVVGEHAKQLNDVSVRVRDLSHRFSAEDLQIKFQFANLAAKEVASAPDAKIAFEMCLLRMLAFADQELAGPDSSPAPTAANAPKTISGTRSAATLQQSSGAVGLIGERSVPAISSAKLVDPTAQPIAMPEKSKEAVLQAAAERVPKAPEPVTSVIAQVTDTQPENIQAPTSLPICSVEDATTLQQRWQNLVRQLTITGAARELASNAVAKRWHLSALTLTIDVVHSALKTTANVEALQHAIAHQLQQAIDLDIQVDDIDFSQSPAHAYAQQKQQQEQAFADELPERAIVKALIERFDARILTNSVRYTGKA
jgi:DNA polymerase III subunit gamma/tau